MLIQAYTDEGGEYDINKEQRRVMLAALAMGIKEEGATITNGEFMSIIGELAKKVTEGMGEQA